MNPMADPHRAAAPATLRPNDAATLRAEAERLQRDAAAGVLTPMLRGKRIALLCERATDADAVLFERAATELGAQVSHIRPSLLEGPSALETAHTARLLGRLYDAVECQGVAAERVQLLRDAAGVPVFDGLAVAAHLAAQFVDADGPGTAPTADEQHFRLQALLLARLASGY